MPHLRELVQRLRHEPFALVGVNTGDSEEAYRQGLVEHEMTWACAYQGPKASPIADLYRVQAYPTILVLDGEGRIRYRDVRGAALGKAVDALLEEARAAEAGK